jgi:hypothetical protein
MVAYAYHRDGDLVGRLRSWSHSVRVDREAMQVVGCLQLLVATRETRVAYATLGESVVDFVNLLIREFGHG